MAPLEDYALTGFHLAERFRSGMGDGPVPLSEMAAVLDELGVADPDRRAALRFLWSVADDERLKLRREKREARAGGAPSRASPRRSWRPFRRR